MKALIATGLALLIIPLWDWASVTRMGIYATNCDYRYWPLSKARLISVLALIVSVALVGTFADASDPPIWLLLVAGLALVTWGLVGFADVWAQNRKGYRAPPPPPQYSDPRF